MDDDMKDVTSTEKTPTKAKRKRRTRDERKAKLQERRHKIDAELKEIDEQEKAEARKKRNHRLIKIGAEVEKIYGHEMTDEEIVAFTHKLATIIAQESKPIATPKDDSQLVSKTENNLDDKYNNTHDDSQEREYHPYLFGR